MHLVSLHMSCDYEWFYQFIMTFWDQGDIKTKKFKIGNIHCERRFLYILGDPGP